MVETKKGLEQRIMKTRICHPSFAVQGAGERHRSQWEQEEEEKSECAYVGVLLDRAFFNKAVFHQFFTKMLRQLRILRRRRASEMIKGLHFLSTYWIHLSRPEGIY